MRSELCWLDYFIQNLERVHMRSSASMRNFRETEFRLTDITHAHLPKIWYRSELTSLLSLTLQFSSCCATSRYASSATEMALCKQSTTDGYSYMAIYFWRWSSEGEDLCFQELGSNYYVLAHELESRDSSFVSSRYSPMLHRELEANTCCIKDVVHACTS